MLLGSRPPSICIPPWAGNSLPLCQGSLGHKPPSSSGFDSRAPVASLVRSTVPLDLLQKLLLPPPPAARPPQTEVPAALPEEVANVPQGRRSPRGPPPPSHWRSSVPVGRCAVQAIHSSERCGGWPPPVLQRRSVARVATTSGAVAASVASPLLLRRVAC